MTVNNFLKSLLSFLLLLLFCTEAIADGAAFRPVVDSSVWHIFRETSQLCFINYKDQTQNMLINVTLNDDFIEDKAIWLFPIPSKPDEIKIDIIKSLPILRGKDFIKELTDIIEKKYFYIMGSQFYPLYLIFEFYRGGNQIGHSSSEGIDVIRKIENYGITSELISVKNKQSFFDYLSKHKIIFSNNFNNILNDYINNDYIFVLSWISNSKDYKNTINAMKGYSRIPIALSVSFKTPKLFFPLKFTSIYDKDTIPVNIYYFNLIEPEIYNEILNKTTTKHLIMDFYSVPDDLKNFFFNNNYFYNLKYTKITINAEASNYSKDLWLDPNPSYSLYIKLLIYEYPEACFAIFFILLSMTASYIACKLSFKRSTPHIKGFLLISLLNFLSISGFIFGLYLTKANKVLLTSDGNPIDLAAKKSSNSNTSFFIFILSLPIFGAPCFFNLFLDLKIELFLYVIFIILIYKTINWYREHYELANYIVNFSLLFSLFAFISLYITSFFYKILP